MRFLHCVGVFAMLAQICSPQTFNNQPNINNNNLNQLQQQQQRPLGGLSFAIPGLNLLGGGGGLGVGGGLFGAVTVTRTLVSTVSTVTTASFRTCTTSAGVLMPCVGRRKRHVEDENDNQVGGCNHDGEAGMDLIIGTTTLTDAAAVTEYLDAHKLKSQSVIYPPGVELGYPRKELEELTTVLYPSQDTPETTANDLDAGEEFLADEVASITTETPSLQDEYNDDASESGTTPSGDDQMGMEEKARVGLGKTTTVTTVIRVTSVATTLATGPMATLTIMYTGCSPQQFPVSGVPCVT